jgi:dihydroorotate dehydrogenase electron transfer subunit
MNSDRNTINICDCKVLAHYHFQGEQYILTFASEEISKSTQPGQFVHITVSTELEMRRPFSVMSVDEESNTFDILYKVVGEGTRQLSESKIGDVLSVIGPIGNGFKLSDKKNPLLIGGGVGMPPMIAIAQKIKANDYYQPFVILGSEVPFPFEATTSEIEIPFKGPTHTMPLLEGWGIACRLASMQGFDGAFKGYVTDLARKYLDALPHKELSQVEIYSCGPRPMLEAVAELSKEYKLPCQVSLEEFMACAVGGCAGCAVEVKSDEGVLMKRVCVDGPVFEAQSVF